VSLTAANVGTALVWAAGAAAAAWLVSWPVRRRSLAWLVVSVALVGTAASVAALLGAVHSMLLPMGENVQLVLLSLLAGLLALIGAGFAARRIAREQRAAAAAAESRERERALEASRRELVAWLSHDLRTPLAGLRAMTEALEDGLAADPQLYYKQIGDSVDRLSAMVADLFQLSRIHAGTHDVRADTIDMPDLLSSCLAGLQPLAAARQVALSAHADLAASVRGDPGELHRALTNVVANAIRHTPERGRVEVSLAAAGDGAVELRVEDECGGLPDDVLARVFDVGFRAAAARGSTPDDGGAGLGLAITRGILEAHGGTASVENTAGGCRFRLGLPVGQVLTNRERRAVQR
jgi:signal transduction histidine kinase